MILVSALLLLQAQAPPPAHWDTVVHTTFHWRRSGPAYDFLIDEPTRDSTDDDRWQRARIRVPDGRRYDVRGLEGPFVTVHEGLFDSLIAADNTSGTQFAYLAPKLRGGDGSPMLVLFGYAYASDPGSLQILALDRTGYPYVAFASPMFQLMGLTDLDGDGAVEIIGRHSFSQCGGCDDCSYDPYAVYQLAPRYGARATYSLSLSRQYNRAHYVWAGPRMSEHIAVNTCDADKPHLAGAAK